jgi:hypothetical protein
MAEFVYLTQDFCWSSDEGRFLLTLHSETFALDIVQALNQSMRYEDLRNGKAASSQHHETNVLVFCTCKLGNPSGELEIRFQDTTNLIVSWPGVSRVFVRVRIMESTTAENMTVMLLDDIEGGHSLSDVDQPERNRSFRPWSDDENSDLEGFEE